MDDKPAIEYHPFGTITLNFDDHPVKLRRCRLGDLEFGKNLLEELRATDAEQRETLLRGMNDLVPVITAPFPPDAPDEAVEERRGQIKQFNQTNDQLTGIRINLVWEWLAKIATRMGDGPIPPKEDWPIDLLAGSIPNDVITHWQTRPLASGRPNPNGTISEAASSELSAPTVSSPQAPPPR